MSGKSARRLRRLTEQTLNVEQGSTTISGNSEGYKEHPVLSNERAQRNGLPVMTKTIRAERKSARAFYQESKKIYKTGEGEKEADRIKKEYKKDQLAEAKRIAKEISGIVEGTKYPKQEGNLNPMHWLDGLANWAIDNGQPLAKCLPFQILTGLSSEADGYLTVTALDQETQQGLMFVASATGYIRAYDGEIIQLVNVDKPILETYEEVQSILLADLRPTDEIKNMEIK